MTHSHPHAPAVAAGPGFRLDRGTDAMPPGPVPADSAAPATPATGLATRPDAWRGPPRLVGSAAVLLLADIAPAGRAWGAWRFVRGPGAFARVEGLRFAKVLGSGHEGGFGLKPSASRQGLFAAFDDDAAAARFIESSPWIDAYRTRSREFIALRLSPYASRGSWSGCALSPAALPPAGGPVAALTRASIRPSRAARFWSMAPAAQVSLEAAAGCRLAAGLGEAPLLRQATFSVWDDVAAMDAYARTGAHLAAIRASAAGRFFSESMFVRFVVADARGTYRGRRLG